MLVAQNSVFDLRTYVCTYPVCQNGHQSMYVCTAIRGVRLERGQLNNLKGYCRWYTKEENEEQTEYICKYTVRTRDNEPRIATTMEGGLG